MAVAVQVPHDVPTTLNYFTEIGEPPYSYSPQVDDSAIPQGKPRSNVASEPHPAVINDVRGKEDTVGLDKTGFQFVEHKSSETEFLDEERIKTVYYKEVEELLKHVTGGKRVFIFDHTIRYAYMLDICSLLVLGEVTDLPKKIGGTTATSQTQEGASVDPPTVCISTNHSERPSTACTTTSKRRQSVSSRVASASSMSGVPSVHPSHTVRSQ